MSVLKMYDTFPLEVERAKGIYIYSKSGEEYIDTFSGIGVTNLGHSHEPLLERFKLKMDRYMHLCNFYIDEDLFPVAEKLVYYTGREGKVFFASTGTEAMECALKAIKKVRKGKKLIYFSGAFHGRTTGALSINGIKKIRDIFLPLLPDTVELPFNDREAFENYMRNNSDTGAVFFEPVQGSGGVMPIKPDFIKVIAKYKKEYDYIVVSDEIQAGMGRTGKVYAYQNFEIEPDILTLGKALGGGMPIGATVFSGETSGFLKQGEHGTTFGPSPISLAGARYYLEILPDLIKDIPKKAEYFRNKIKSLNNDKILQVRGLGLMLGIVLDKEYPELKNRAFKEENLLLNFLVNNSVIRLLPPLNIKYEEIDIIVERIGRLF